MCRPRRVLAHIACRYSEWLRTTRAFKVAVVEIGAGARLGVHVFATRELGAIEGGVCRAGLYVPTVRATSERVAQRADEGTLIRCALPACTL